MSGMFGKKVSILGHSLGTVVITNTLYNMPQSLKDDTIARFIGVGPALMGVTHAISSIISFDRLFYKELNGLKFGLDNEAKSKMFPFWGSLFSTLPKPTLIWDKDEPYVKAIQQYIDHRDRGKPRQNGTVMDIFPSDNETCVPFFQWRRTKSCRLELSLDPRLVKILDKWYTAEQIPDLLEKYSFIDQAKAIYEKYQEKRFFEFLNPGVQTNVIFSQLFWSSYSIQYNYNPKDLTKDLKTSLPSSRHRVPSDGALTANSMLIPFIKWADQHRRGAEDAHPVDFIEMCSVYKRRKSVFDPEVKEEKKVTENAYFGVKCDCEEFKEEKRDPQCSHHAAALMDRNLIAFLINSSMDGQTSRLGEDYSLKNDSFFDSFLENCELFNNNEE